MLSRLFKKSLDKMLQQTFRKEFWNKPTPDKLCSSTWNNDQIVEKWLSTTEQLLHPCKNFGMNIMMVINTTQQKKTYLLELMFITSNN